MPLINNTGLPASPTATNCTAAAKTAFSVGQWAYSVMFNALWKNPHGLTVPQAFAAIGTAYTAMAADMGPLGQFLLAEGFTLPTMPTGWTVAVNPDGSATPTQS
jgi:hypothetical protein